MSRLLSNSNSIAEHHLPSFWAILIDPKLTLAMGGFEPPIAICLISEDKTRRGNLPCHVNSLRYRTNSTIGKSDSLEIKMSLVQSPHIPNFFFGKIGLPNFQHYVPTLSLGERDASWNSLTGSLFRLPVCGCTDVKAYNRTTDLYHVVWKRFDIGAESHSLMRYAYLVISNWWGEPSPSSISWNTG